MHQWPAPRVLAILLAAASFSGCYERKETAILNPNGSGKMLIETDVAVPAAGEPGKEKPTALSFGRQLMADFINNSQGVDSWADVSITEAPDGRAHLSAVAYFPDISTVRFDLPVAFAWTKQESGNWMLSLGRPRSEPAATREFSAVEIKDQVAKAQAQYKEQQPGIQTALSTFTLQINFILPGEVIGTHIFQKKDQGVTVTLEGKKIAVALDKLMADDAAIAATIKSGKDLIANDEILLQAMYGQKGPIAALVKIPPATQPIFNYGVESKTAMLNQHEMLQAAGVVLIQPFVVKPPASQPGGR